ncbi:MAG TPA: DUF4124 domain-containing protein [Methylotenera sp.]|nr:DUF4124 domain-containing protein [Methylotenera sp.]
MNTKSFTTSVLFSALYLAGMNTASAFGIYKSVSSTGIIIYSGVPTAGSTTIVPAPTTSTAPAPAPTTSTAPAATSTPISTALATTTSTVTNLVTDVTKLLTENIFTTTSFWYKPIPTTVVLHPNSANFVKEFIRQKTTYYNNVNINTNSYSSPVYIAASNTPTVKVGFYDCQKKGWTDATFASMVSAVPIPAVAKQSSGTDGEMTIYQPSTNTIWELWVSKKDTVTGNWTACWGGKLTNAISNQGIFPQNYGTTATSLPFLGGQITAEELSRGEIKHVIGISLVEVEKASIYSWPANRSDGYNPNNVPNRIAEGQRFRLDPNVNVDALPMTRAGKIIAKAAQKYGFVVWDKAGSVGIRAQNADSYTALGLANPYPALYENKPAYAVLNGFPWDKLQFLPMNYGKP